MLEILQSIDTRRFLRFNYKDESQVREVEVYILGINYNGNTLVRAFEMASGWKLFDVSKMNNLDLLNKKALSLRPGYKRTDKAFKKIVEQV